MLGLTHLSHPESWWAAFSAHSGASNEHDSDNDALKALSQAIERFPTDSHRHSRALVSIWLQYLELFWRTSQGDVEECRRLYKWLGKAMHASIIPPQYYLQWAAMEVQAGEERRAITVLSTGLDAFTQDPPSNDIIRKALHSLQTTGQLPSKLSDPHTHSQSHHHNVLMTPASAEPAAKPAPLFQATSTNILASMTASSHLKTLTSLPSDLSHISATKTQHQASTQQTIPSSAARRLGLNGPPKRVLPTNEQAEAAEESPVKRIRNLKAADGNEDELTKSPTDNVSTGKKTALFDLDTGRLGQESEATFTQTAAVTSTTQLLKDASKDRHPTVSGNSNGGRVVKLNGRTFKVLQLMGKGGSSKVYKVLCLSSPASKLASDDDAVGEEERERAALSDKIQANQVYALKRVSLKNVDAATLEGYVNEIGMLRKFADSPHIIRLYDWQHMAEAQQLLLLMECGDTDLCRLIQNLHRPRDEASTEEQLAHSPAIDANFVRYYFGQMLECVQTVHSKRVVHCDLKPANFLVVQGRLKLIDFGISKQHQLQQQHPPSGNNTSTSLNGTTSILREHQVGTVNYMSPEALQETSSGTGSTPVLKMGRASDIWSLGCILHEMAFGRPPFAHLSLVQRLQRIMDPSHIIDVPAGHPMAENGLLVECIRGCLIRTPKLRYTLRQLWEHPFLRPHASRSSRDEEDGDRVTVSRQQLDQLSSQIAAKLPGVDGHALSAKLWELWRSSS